MLFVVLFTTICTILIGSYLFNSYDERNIGDGDTHCSIVDYEIADSLAK